MNFLFDACISVKIARALAALEDARRRRILHHKDEPTLGVGVGDVDWIQWAALQVDTWIAVSVDSKLLKRPLERRQIEKLKVSLVVAPKEVTNKRLWEQASWWVDKWPGIVEVVDAAAPGIFELQLNGTIRRYTPF